MGHVILQKLILGDVKKNRFSVGAMMSFVAVSVLLFSLTIILFANLSGAIDGLMNRAKTPDFLQMHTGTLPQEEIRAFAEGRTDLEAWQICGFLNLENSEIVLGGENLVNSTQDNGVCIQSPYFDFLLDMQNQLPDVKAGEVYVPMCYKQKYKLQIGQSMEIGETTLKIAGFMRDSQMSAMMASSKRFLVNQGDYEKLKPQGLEEYLIEFLLRKGADINAFSDDYINAALPANGPTITRPLIKIMNELAEGITILIIFLVSLLVLVIAFICIRFILLTRMEKEKKEIGMLKALGIARRDIRELYFSKYVCLSGIGGIIGLIIAWLIYKPMTQEMQELYGVSDHLIQSVLCSLVGAALIVGCILLFIRRLLNKMEGITALNALFERPQEDCNEKKRQRKSRKNKGNGRQVYIAIVVAIGVFMMLIPTNLYSTMSSEKFVTYMGIGNAEICMDIRQTDDLAKKTTALLDKLKLDPSVQKFTYLQTQSMEVVLPDETKGHLIVEWGDHTVFPISFYKGRVPQKEGEIAISVLNAQSLGMGLGDTIHIIEDGAKKDYVICGIYSDITNGGKTTKAYKKQTNIQDREAMWHVIYVSLIEGADQAKWTAAYQDWTQELEGLKARDTSSAGIKVVSVKDFLQGTYGQTLEQIQKVTLLSKGVASFIIFIVVLLFLRLLVEKNRYNISFEKALGFSNKDIRNKYLINGLIYSVSGVVIGIILGGLSGEKLCAIALQLVGATGFKFVWDYSKMFCQIPMLTLIVSTTAIWFGILEITNIKAYECCSGKE